MSIPKPPFHSVSEELLYNIYLKFEDMNSLKESDINTLAKLNAILIDADLMKVDDIVSAIDTIKGNVPVAGDSLAKLYTLIQGLGNLKSEDIDTLAELNAILSDADVVSTNALNDSISSLKGDVPGIADTLEKLYKLMWLSDGNSFGSTKPIGTKDDYSLPFITNSIERARITNIGQFLIGIPEPFPGLESYKLQLMGDNALAISGNSVFQDGSVNFALGKPGTSIANTFRINSYFSGLGGFEFLLSAANVNASIEISDYLFGGTKNEMIRLSPGGYANTGILIRPNDAYNTSFGYRYLLQGTNAGLQGRYISAFHAQINLPADDAFADLNRAQMFAAQATVTNHFIDGFYSDVRSANENAQTYAFHSTGSRVFFNGEGMNFFNPVVKISTDSSPHPGATNSIRNGSNVLSAGLFIAPMGAERTGMIISPGHPEANGLFISSQSLGSYNYDGHLLWLQYSTTGNNMLGSTAKPMLYIRKHNTLLNGFDHSGAFICMEENISSTGNFIEAFKYDQVNNASKLKFSVNKDGIVSIGQVATDPDRIDTVGRLYFMNEQLKFVSPSGDIRTVSAF